MRFLALPALAAGLALAIPAKADKPLNDYPTAARADYVFGCMATNGDTRDALQRCSCSIDVIATLLPFADYEKAETVLRMRRNTGGYLAETFRSHEADQILRGLEEAQAEAEVRCF